MGRIPDGRAAASGRWWRRAVLAAFALSIGAAAVGNALTPLLLRESPVTLLAVQSSYAQMGLARARVDPTTFVVIAGLRRWLGEVVAFAAGAVLGERVLDWYARRTGARVRVPERLHTTWAWARDLVVVALPHPLLSALFGVSGMSPRRFVVLKLIGSLWFVAAFWHVAGTAAAPLAATTAFVEANAWILTGVAVALVAGWGAWRWRTPGDPSAGDGPEDVPDDVR